MEYGCEAVISLFFVMPYLAAELLATSLACIGAQTLLIKLPRRGLDIGRWIAAFYWPSCPGW